MAKRAVHVTRTFGPIHFEDLDPHRFEDLVRELIYDFRQWQSIESTGRTGKDGGFDVRAFERNTSSTEEVVEGEEEAHPMEGNRWMIQGKREKELGPAAVRKILEDVDAADPPYGYILAASANFSKESYDAFREVLRAKGVMEFYLWGKPDLENMLHLPKNDRILFTFFGISLTSKRRTRTTEVRSLVITKNKLFKVLGPAKTDFYTEVLLRDINDEHYPYRNKYTDFAERPRWLHRTAFQHHPLGFQVHSRQFYAYVDRQKQEWDFTQEVDLLWHSSDSDEEKDKKVAGRARVAEVWEYLPRSMQGEFAVEAFVRYSDVYLVDSEGDSHYHCPHIYADFLPERGPYARFFEILEIGGERHYPDDWTKIDFFPKNFSSVKSKLNVRSDVRVTLDAATLKNHLDYKSDADTLFAVDDRYDTFAPKDVVQLANTAEGQPHFLRITYKGKMRMDDYVGDYKEQYNFARFASQQIGRAVDKNEELTIVEVARIYPHQWEA